MKKIIYNITPFTTVDYKNHLSCIVWFITCNMRCLYCYNPEIVNAKSGEYTVDDLFYFLKKRVGLLDSVVLSGGEATIHNLIDICRKIKNLKLKIKLDTNGSNPNIVHTLLKDGLIDFVSLDFKSTRDKFMKITKSNYYDNFLLTLNLLLNSNIEYEVRTTLHEDLLNEEDINKMQKILFRNGYSKNYFIQKFLEVENLSKLKKSKKDLDKTRIENRLNIIYRD